MILLCFSTWFLLFKKKNLSKKAEDLLDLAPILQGILTRLCYNELKITTQDFSRKLGEGGLQKQDDDEDEEGNENKGLKQFLCPFFCVFTFLKFFASYLIGFVIFELVYFIK